MWDSLNRVGAFIEIDVQRDVYSSIVPVEFFFDGTIAGIEQDFPLTPNPGA